jgi:hypothetical protein
MRKSDVNEWLNDEVVSFYNTTSLVDLSSPDEHVGVVNRRNDDVPTYPFVGIQSINSTPKSAGMGNRNVFADTLNYDTNDVIQSIDYRKDVSYRVELIPVTNDDVLLRDDLAEELGMHISLVTRVNRYPDDIKKLDVDTTSTGGRPEDFIDSESIPLDIKYSSFITHDDVTAAETVNVDIDVTDDTPYDENDADAFDETF